MNALLHLLLQLTGHEADQLRAGVGLVVTSRYLHGCIAKPWLSSGGYMPSAFHPSADVLKDLCCGRLHVSCNSLPSHPSQQSFQGNRARRQSLPNVSLAACTTSPRLTNHLCLYTRLQ
jgi:hypothetical protein